MQQWSEHVTYQLPNKYTRVGYVLDVIECNNAPLQAAMASIRVDTSPTGKRNNFEDMATHLLLYNPVAEKRLAETKRPAALANVNANFSASVTKTSIRKSRVHL